MIGLYSKQKKEVPLWHAAEGLVVQCHSFRQGYE